MKIFECRKIGLCLLLAALLFPLTAKAGINQWSNIGPVLGSTEVLAIDPTTSSTLYVGTNGGGVFKSTNSGNSWSNSGLKDENIAALVMDPNGTTLYAGSTAEDDDYNSLFKSTDGGSTWVAASGLTNVIVNSIAIHPANTATLYVGTDGNGVYKSINSGDNWIGVNSGLASSYINALAIDPSGITVYAGTDAGLFCSTDGGSNWNLMFWGGGSSIESFVIDPVTPTTLYAGTGGLGVYKSVNGWIWNSIGLNGWSVRGLVIDPSGTNVYATNGGSILKSNGIDNWIQLTPNNKYVAAIATDPNASNILYIATHSNGIEKSLNGGTTWIGANNGLTALKVFSLVIDPKDPATMYAGTFGEHIFKTIDRGLHWNYLESKDWRGRYVLSLAMDPSGTTLYAGSWDGVFMSINGGSEWLASGLTEQVRCLAIDPENPSVVYAGTNGNGVYKTEDGGATWSAHGLSGFYVRSLAINPKAHLTLYAGTHDGGVFKSSNGGDNWTEVNTGLNHVRVRVLAFDPNGTTIYAGLPTGVFYKTDNSSTWTGSSSAIGYVWALAIDPKTPTTLYVGTWGGGIFRSIDGGINWTAFNTGLTDMVVQALAIDPVRPMNIYAGTYGSGVFARNEDDSASRSTILYNAKIYTMENDSPAPEAILINGNRIGAIGSNKDILRMAKADTKLIDVGGRALFPGFIDPHTHLFNDGPSLGYTYDQLQQMALETGLTSLADMFINPFHIEKIKPYADLGQMRLRLFLYLIYNDSCGTIWGNWYENYPPNSEIAPKVRMNGVKIFSERSGCGNLDIAPVFSKKLLRSFTPEGLAIWGENRLFLSREQMTKIIRRAEKRGYQVAIHAIGDLGIETSLDGIEGALQNSLNRKNINRHMILHNHFIRNDLMHLYRENNIIALVEPARTCQAEFYASYVGEQNMKYFKRWREIVATGTRVAVDGDWPSVFLDPMPKLFAMVTGNYGTCTPSRPLQKLSLSTSIRMMTCEAAYALHYEKEIGSLKVGKLADMVVLSQDPYSVDPNDFMTIKVLMTMVGGNIEFLRDTNNDGIPDLFD